MKYKPSSLRHWVSTQTQWDTRKTLSRASTNLTIGNNEHNGPGHSSSSRDPPLPTQSPTVNVILFGETGVGKSSVINLIARKEVAQVSSDVNGCTMQSTRYNISFDDMNFAIFDTIGLEEPQMGVNGYLKAIEKAYELIVNLDAAGGIHLLLFCMRGGRITATTQSNYRLFCECLCSKKVPIALVFTGLEREVEMEDWWKRNEAHIAHYGIKSNGHACITAVQDDTLGEDLKYTESQRKIREILKTYALKNEAFALEPHPWLARVGNLMRSLIKKQKIPGRRNVMRVLTQRCKLDPETARKIVDMMERNDTENKDAEKNTPEDERRITESDSGDKSALLDENLAGHSPANPQGYIEDGYRNDRSESGDKSAVRKENTTGDENQADRQGNVDSEAERRSDQLEGNVGEWSMGRGNGGDRPQDSRKQTKSEGTNGGKHEWTIPREGEGGSTTSVENVKNDGDLANLDVPEGSVYDDDTGYHTAPGEKDIADEHDDGWTKVEESIQLNERIKGTNSQNQASESRL